jgi:D-glycero-alpha-D-manno-heptose-7-phosphate kinase
VYVTVNHTPHDHIKISYMKQELVTDVNDIKNDIVRNALKYFDIHSNIEITSFADIPTMGTGLGGSSTFTCALVAALAEYQDLEYNPFQIAETACHIEIDQMGEPVGKQDQYIAAFGGMTVFDIAKDGQVCVRPVKISDINLYLFMSNLQVYSLDTFRNASDILSEQNKMGGNTESILNTVKEYGYKSLELIESCNFDDYGILMDKYWQLKKQLSSKITVGKFDDIYEEVKRDHNVLGGKIIGAGGGGFLMLYVNKNHAQLEQFMKSRGFWRLPFGIDKSGSKVLF